MRKLVIITVLIVLLASMSACGASSQSENQSKGKEVSIDYSNLNLKDLIWSGIDPLSGDKYILSFDENSVDLQVIDSSETENEYVGTYELSESGLKINGIDLIKDSDSVTLNIDNEKSYIIINNIILTPSDATDIKTVAENLVGADRLNTLLNSGYCWIAVSNGQALILYVNGDESSIKTVASLGDGKVAMKDLKGTWSLNGSDLVINSDFDGNITDYNWSLEEEDDVICIHLKNIKEDTEAIFYQTTAKNMDTAVEMANQYIMHQISVEEIEDMRHFLDGYEGVSIVDGLIYAGLDPSYDNRKILAEKAGMEGYKGTAEQNLFLIDYMGGMVK